MGTFNNLTLDQFIASNKATVLEMKFLDAWFTYAPSETPEPLCQYRYVHGRRFQCDFAWVSDLTVIVECDGGVTRRGGKAHGSVSGIIRDIERANFAASNMCVVFRCWIGILDDAEKAREFVEMVAKAVMVCRRWVLPAAHWLAQVEV